MNLKFLLAQLKDPSSEVAILTIEYVNALSSKNLNPISGITKLA